MAAMAMKSLHLNIPSPISHCQSDFLIQSGITLHMKRDDLIHPLLQGNKWRKLKYNLLAAQQQKQHTLLTFGGAFSNHIHATAAAGKLLGFKTIGIIRGEAHSPLNPTLQDASNWGMQLEYINRADYRQKHTEAFISKLHHQYGDFYLIPEGGSNTLAMQGCAEINTEIQDDYDFICQACGTGTTLAGLISSAREQTQILGFAVLKSAAFLIDDVSKKLNDGGHKKQHNWNINLNYHFGGYAKTQTALLDFINSFKTQYAIQLEPVYTGKMMYGIFDLIRKGHFPKGSRVLAIHSGGLQGLRGFEL